MNKGKKFPMQMHVYVDPASAALWRKAAASYRMNMSALMRFVCDSCAKLPTPKIDRFLMGKAK